MEKARILGFRYVMDFAKSYAEKKAKDDAFRIYVTDCIKGIVDNTARFNGGVTVTKRFIEIIESAKNTDIRTPEEIKKHICDKLRAMGGDDDGEPA